MNKTVATLVFSVVALAITGVIRAEERDPNEPIPEQRQDRLLERFGEKGIDADEDGTLTREEVRAFFADRPRDGRRGGLDLHNRGLGKRGNHEGKMHRLAMTLHHIELFSASTPPEHFDLTKHLEADLDRDGQLSNAEWRAFAQEKRDEIITRLARRMPDADGDGDGTLNAEELQAVESRLRTQVLERDPEADSDGDGVLSQDEFAAFRAAHIEKHRRQILEHNPEADLDGDGTLSDAEMHEFGADHYGFEAYGGKGRRAARRGARDRGRVLRRHPEADLDEDGTLSDEELRAFRETRRGRGRTNTEE